MADQGQNRVLIVSNIGITLKLVLHLLGPFIHIDIDLPLSTVLDLYFYGDLYLFVFLVSARQLDNFIPNLHKYTFVLLSIQLSNKLLVFLPHQLDLFPHFLQLPRKLLILFLKGG